MRQIFALFGLCAALGVLAGCSHYVPRGVDVTIRQGANTWQACSLSVWHDYDLNEGESNLLHFTDSNGQRHDITGQYRIDYSKTACY